ncbi:glycosyltransferase family 4 protein, partial [candidate division KSB1 bacterium]
ENGVDTELFKEGNKKEQQILYTGRLIDGKGLSELLAAAKIIYASFPDIKFIILGEGHMKNRLKDTIKKKSIKNVVIKDYVKHDNIVKYYKKSIAYVLPSYYENMPTGILEAMSSGLPVVASDVGGIPELVIDNKTGFLVKPKNEIKLAESIIKLMVNKKLREIMGKKGKERVEENFTWNIITKKFVKMYIKNL